MRLVGGSAMQIATYSGRICRQCVETRVSNAPSRGISNFTRRRQKRTMSAQASTWPSQPAFVDPFPFYHHPAPLHTPIDWKGKARAIEERDEAAVEEIGLDRSTQKEAPSIISTDYKGKARAIEEVKQEVELEEVDLSQSKQKDRSLFVLNTNSISLNLLQAHCNELQTAWTQLSLLLWLTGMTRAPTNDVRHRGRRWHVNVYRRPELEQRQNIRPLPGRMPTSIDLLCADIIKREVRGQFCIGDLWLLKKLSFRALKLNGFRTLKAIEDMLKDDDVYALIEQLPDSLDFLLSMKECFFIKQAKRGEWEQVWQRKDEILALLRRRKELNQTQLPKSNHDDWQLDVVLVKSLTAHCAQHYADHRRVSTSELQVDLAKDRYYMKHITLLLEQVKEINGEISDIWLSNLIIGLARGVQPDSRLDTLSLVDYFDRLALTNLAQRLFHEQRQKTDPPSTRLMHAMLELESSWERQCRSYKDIVGKKKMLQQAEKHHYNVKKLLQLLKDDQHRAALKQETEPLFLRRQVMEDLLAKAKATRISVKYLLSQGDYQTALRRLEAFLGSVRPDEDYFYLTGARTMPSQRWQQGSTAKAMMSTRRQTRGCLISICLHLNSCLSQDKAQAVPILLQLMKESVERGVWDPWPISRDITSKMLKLLKMKAHLVDPPADLSALCSRLLGMCRPVLPVHRNNVSEGCSVVDEHLSSTFCKVLEGIALLHQTMESRIDLLQQMGLLKIARNRTSSRNTLRDIFVDRGTSAAQCVWAILANKKETELISSRLDLLFEHIFIPLGVQEKGWVSAGKALEQHWPAYADSSILKPQVWSQYEKTYRKRFSASVETPCNENDGKVRRDGKMVRRNLLRREKLKERKRIAMVKTRSRAIRKRMRRW